MQTAGKSLSPGQKGEKRKVLTYAEESKLKQSLIGYSEAPSEKVVTPL